MWMPTAIVGKFILRGVRGFLPDPVRRGGMKLLHTEVSFGWIGQKISSLEESRGLIERGLRAVARNASTGRLT